MSALFILYTIVTLLILWGVRRRVAVKKEKERMAALCYKRKQDNPGMTDRHVYAPYDLYTEKEMFWKFWKPVSWFYEDYK